ncbi:PqqD family protein [Mesorhizobium sp. VNQ89]|uniref:PqqD family protein n=1 Tax=Mesorhizobium quangtriensis TaxID=3157709 RepID=UPI0032B8332C
MTTEQPGGDISPSTKLELAPEVIVKSMGDDEGGVLLRRDSGEMFTANDTTIFFLNELDGSKQVGDIAASMADVFEVTTAELESDLVELARELLSQNLVRVA